MINYHADVLDAGLGKEIDSDGDTDYMGTTDAKELIDQCEFLIGTIYGLDEAEIEYLQEYNSEFARSGPEKYTAVPGVIERAGSGENRKSPVPLVGFSCEIESSGSKTPPF
jgi:hypothetical protein